ncbi:MAG TPA: NAD(P)-binding domain-containing protein [Burkholderiales bacterium]|nr:NAD(P)-binding domain-containing protein [Burkholderiales bacterium]
MIGFIGLGVMGEPMCRDLASKSGAVRWSSPGRRTSSSWARGTSSQRSSARWLPATARSTSLSS